MPAAFLLCGVRGYGNCYSDWSLSHRRVPRWAAGVVIPIKVPEHQAQTILNSLNVTIVPDGIMAQASAEIQGMF